MNQHLREGWAGLQTHATGTGYYHGIGKALAPGDALRGGGPGNYQPDTYTRPGAIYVTDSLDMAFFYAVFGPFSSADFFAEPHVYEVEVTGDQYSRPGEWTVDTAIVRSDVTAQAKAAFRARWETFWKPTILAAESSGMPTPQMIVVEFEMRMK